MQVKKIIFMCGSAEKEKDGVGDYTRRLSAELIRTGIEASIIALNDRYISTQREECQEEQDVAVRVLRLPESILWSRRMKTANTFINDFKPQFVSLQYVPFSFHRKGIPTGLAGKLKDVANGAGWHIMFHELWIGIDKESLMKHKITGLLQKKLAKRLISALSPVAVHTHTRLYQNLLEKLGQHTNLLPLFGNIPLLHNAVKKHTGSVPALHFVLFGGIHYGAPVTEFTEELASYASEKQAKVNITCIGLNGPELETWLQACSKANIPVAVLGKQSSQTISEALLQADFGITTTPIILTQKSGSVAAMKEHQLPVICVARQWIPNIAVSFAPDAGVYEYHVGALQTFLQQPHPVPVSKSLSDIASQFINDIS